MGKGDTTYVIMLNYKVLTVNRNGTIQGHIASRLSSASHNNVTLALTSCVQSNL